MALEDAADVTLSNLTFNGDKLNVDLAKAMTGATLRRTMDGAPTLTIQLFDPYQRILTSGIFAAEKKTAQIDGKGFSLVQMTKSGSTLSLIFEDLAVAQMRLRTTPTGIEPNAMTRFDFAKKLLAEEGTSWIPIYMSPGASLEVTKVPLARGTVASDTADTGVNPNYFGQSSELGGGSLKPVDLARLAAKAGFSGNDLVIAVAVSMAENGASNPGAINDKNSNGSQDYGLWQINSVHKNLLSKYNWKDPQQNAIMAYQIFKGSGWRAWSTYNDGKYKKNLGAAQAAAGNITSLKTETTDEASLTPDQRNRSNREKLLGGAEDTWTCIKRIFAEINWRAYVDWNPQNVPSVYVGPDSGFIIPKAEINLTEESPGVDNIDWDFDIAKASASATVTCRAHRYQLPPGTMVNLPTTGLPNPWIVSTNDRSYFTLQTTITLKRPEPALPEPEASEDMNAFTGADYFGSPEQLAASDPTGGTSVSIGSYNSDASFQFPLNTVAKITDVFGAPRPNGRKHQGIDYGIPLGTGVYASRDGTVKLADAEMKFDAKGYGKIVIIKHDQGTETYYAHLSKVGTAVGKPVKAGELIGLSGQSGNPSGPCLHFEIRANGVPTDPIPWMTAKRSTSGGGGGGGGGGAGAN